MEWDGLRYDDTASGSGALIAQNSRFYVDGELQRRPGLESVSVGSVVQALCFVTFGDLLGNQYIVLVNSTGTIQTVAV